MLISKDTENVIAFINEATDNNFRKLNDISNLLEISASFSKPQDFVHLLQIGASVWNLYKTIEKSKNEQGIHQLFAEFESTKNDFVQKLQDLLNLDTDESKERFDTHYFCSTSGCLLNLLDLAHDFQLFKTMQITVERNLKQSSGK